MPKSINFLFNKVKYYIIAGEASGDLHGSRLIEALSRHDSEAVFRCWGGDLMQALPNVSLAKHIRELAFMGFVEILSHLRTIKRNFKFCKQDILNFQPDVVIFIDYPGFNLRMAEFVKENGLKTFYYISPQLWAWKKGRIETVRKYIDKMFVILPFEKTFYKQNDIDVVYEGHPLKDIVDEAIAHEDDSDIFVNKPVIALLPGSRKQEIRRKLPVMLQVTKHFTDYQFVIAGAPSISETFYKQFIPEQNILILYNQTYTLLKRAKAALVTSGTATLETALFGVPEIVCYKSGLLSYWIAKQLIKVKYISLVNLIMDKPVIKELIQKDCRKEMIVTELQKLLTDHTYQNRIIADYEALRIKLGDSGMVERIGKQMISLI